VSDAASLTLLISLLAVLFDVLAHFLAQRTAQLLRLLGGLGWLNLLGDFFGDDSFGFDAEVFVNPAAHLFSDLGEPLHRR